MNNLLIGIFFFFIGGIASIFVKENYKAVLFLIFSSIAQIFILPVIFAILKSGGQFESALLFSEPIGTAFIRLDSLAAVFSLIISIGALLASVYSIEYMKMYPGKKSELSGYYFFLGLMVTSMLLVVIVQNAILFLIVWELMSVSSFFLVNFENGKDEVRKAGIYYFIAMQIGAAFLITSFGWAAAVSGSADFITFKNMLGSSDYTVLLFSLFFIGFGIKAGFVPLHTWLPKAHPAAPTGVSALMSGVMIKMGIYGILRIILLTGTPDYKLSYAVFLISLLTGIFGVVNAIAQHDIKKLLAYHSVENIGIIGMGIGLGMLGLTYNNQSLAILGFLGAILHVFNHFTFKSLLFFGSGVVYSKYHTRNTEKLGGLLKYIPLTSYMFLLGSLAISGLPLFNGFISEFAIYLGMAKGFTVNNPALNITMLTGFSGLALIGVMAVLCFTKVFGICFLGTPRTEYEDKSTKEPFLFILPMIILSSFVLFIGLLPALVMPFLLQIVKQFIPGDISFEFENITQIYSSLGYIYIILIGPFGFFFLLRILLLRKREVSVFKTWDCGYQTDNSRMQYTASSFARPFLQLVGELVPLKIKFKKDRILFPANASLESQTQDYSERFLIQPFIGYLDKTLNRFTWIQSGKLQQYITYGLIFLILLIIWILGAES